MKMLAIITASVALAAVALGQTNTPVPLYVHFGLESSDSTKRLLSARIHLGEALLRTRRCGKRRRSPDMVRGLDKFG